MIQNLIPQDGKLSIIALFKSIFFLIILKIFEHAFIGYYIPTEILQEFTEHKVYTNYLYKEDTVSLLCFNKT